MRTAVGGGSTAATQEWGQCNQRGGDNGVLLQRECLGGCGGGVRRNVVWEGVAGNDKR